MTGMAEFEVTVTYRVEVIDDESFRSAVQEAAVRSHENAAWAVVVDEAGTREVSPIELPPPAPNAESGLALLLAKQAHPRIPGLRFGGMGIDVKGIR